MSLLVILAVPFFCGFTCLRILIQYYVPCYIVQHRRASWCRKFIIYLLTHFIGHFMLGRVPLLIQMPFDQLFHSLMEQI